MNNFSISDIQNLTGIKAHTLRIWEQRYSFLKPKRKESLHRSYDNEDLKHILRITYLYYNGYKISKIAALPEADLKRLTLEELPGSNHAAVYVNLLTEASLDLDQDIFEKELNNIIIRFGFQRTVTEVLFPLLHRIGKLWMVDDISPAQEHFASAIVIKKLIAANDAVSKPLYKQGSRRVLIFAPEKEHHEIPLLLMNYTLRNRGVSTVFVGKNASIEVLRQYCSYQPVTEIYFHVITYLLNIELSAYLRQLSDSFPQQRIICSGIQVELPDDLPKNVMILRTQQEMIDFANS